ncbi:hypothetical protein [Nocardia sp. NPDC024068]|uniref:hypothetical protein n=1 Tax=Nocardia sp. NPDC024068 TaxID=3157197 RepID=UPI0033CBE084
MPTSAAAAPLRGCVVGAATGALALAAHGAAGGGYPTSEGAALLLLTALLTGFAAGAAAGSGRPRSGFAARIGVVLPLAIGQGIGHWALTGLTDHHIVTPVEAAEPQSVMFAAHLIATLVCAVAITAAEQLYRVASAVLRVLLGSSRPLPWAPRCLATATLPTPDHRAPNGAAGPRAPPARGGTYAPISFGEKVFDPCPTGIPLSCVVA